jgi:hypothetical protein
MNRMDRLYGGKGGTKVSAFPGEKEERKRVRKRKRKR